MREVLISKGRTTGIHKWGPGHALEGDKGKQLEVSTPDRTYTGAVDNSRCSAGLDIREHRRADREGTDDRRGVQRDSQNLHHGHGRAGQTTDRGTRHESCNRCLRCREQVRARPVHSTKTRRLL